MMDLTPAFGSFGDKGEEKGKGNKPGGGRRFCLLMALRKKTPSSPKGKEAPSPPSSVWHFTGASKLGRMQAGPRNCQIVQPGLHLGGRLAKISPPPWKLG
jgi:hypothetical protein